MNETTTKHRREEVRIHSSVKITNGKTYAQHCVRWYVGKRRKQRCFGQLPDAEKFRLQVLAEKEGHKPIPSGMWVIIQTFSGEPGPRLLINEKGETFIQKTCEEPEAISLSGAAKAFDDIWKGFEGHEFDVGLSIFLKTVAIRLKNGGAK